ncbi:hypothetical protein JNUCC0626_47625 [Lentzea sp. JNUCC 0626]|uniref:hypothetical protein n=1 Tax=Lentzea sp. JNUCC 0626 TaxID=3367513 RepID=UPI00374A8AF2
MLGIGPSGHNGHTAGVDNGHLVNESTTWNIALGLGLLWTALRPAAISGTLPVTAAFVAVLIPYSGGDLINGTATTSRVLSHSLLLAGLVLLVLVRLNESRPDGGRTPRQNGDTDSAGGTSDTPEHTGRSPVRRRGPLRPVGRHHAA